MVKHFIVRHMGTHLLVWMAMVTNGLYGLSTRCTVYGGTFVHIDDDVDDSNK